MSKLIQWLAHHGPIVMVACCILGFIFPDLSQMLLPTLPYFLFFLMFFTLLGINQRQLLRRMASPRPWLFALLQTGLMCVFCTGLAYLLGARGALLLAIAATTATAPLFATSALVKSIGYDALQAMAYTIAATIIMPVILLVVLWLFAAPDSRIDFGVYTQRLLIFIGGPILLAGFIRQYVNEHILERIYPKVSQIAVILVFTFPFGLVAGFRHSVNTDWQYGLILLAIASVICFGTCILGFFIYRREGLDEAIPAAIASGSRNVLLTLTIAGTYLDTVFFATDWCAAITHVYDADYCKAVASISGRKSRARLMIDGYRMIVIIK
ncbi:hypothetical protein L0B52_01530 [Suttonella sp. R2A3]|uniref:hypothetical protein n=1 Tax=Suttonella sp. R2A3 TaxID=2908648 RepID=UPI001F40CD47|nr:hypothetical protein [Suttonella sp. R2A3]UJF24845.1 hypothetical protein L0B52_01530 [Suttonella sp. R2A3]